jgi:site-specific recombinase XerD
MQPNLPAIIPDQIARAISTCLTGLSLNTQRAYTSGIRSFQAWCNESPPGATSRGLNRESVALWAQNLTARGQSGIAVNQALSAVKRLSTEAANLGWLDWESAVQIQSIKSRKYKGIRSGKWLTLAQVKLLIAGPDRTTMLGKRDAATLALLVGCGLRRQEACELPAQLIQWKLSDQGPVMLIANLNGKGNRVRTLQVPGWAARDIQAWMESAGVTTGKLLRSITK